MCGHRRPHYRVVVSKGIISPWGLRKPAAEPTVEEQLRNRARKGKSPVTLQGAHYQLIITLPVAFKDPKDAEQGAQHVLGEFFRQAKNKAFEDLLMVQKIAYSEEKILSSSVIYDFGVVKLFAAASSSDPVLAKVMGVDRLALSLTQARLTTKGFAKLMEEHFLEIVRNTK